MVKRLVLAAMLCLLVGGVASGETPLPEFLGVYLVENKNLVEMNDALTGGRCRLLGHVKLNEKTLHKNLEERRAPGGVTYGGIATLSGLKTKMRQPQFVAYLQVAPVRYSIGKLKFVAGNVTVGEKLRHEFMRGNRERSVPANIWQLERDIPVKLAPVSGRERMTRVVPREPLEDGVYMLYAYLPTVSSSVEDAIGMWIDSDGQAQSAWFYDFTVGESSANTEVGRIESYGDTAGIPCQTNFDREGSLLKPKKMSTWAYVDLPPAVALRSVAHAAEGTHFESVILENDLVRASDRFGNLEVRVTKQDNKTRIDLVYTTNEGRIPNIAKVKNAFCTILGN